MLVYYLSVPTLSFGFFTQPLAPNQNLDLIKCPTGSLLYMGFLFHTTIWSKKVKYVQGTIKESGQQRHLQNQQTSAGLWTRADPHIGFPNGASYTSGEKETLASTGLACLQTAARCFPSSYREAGMLFWRQFISFPLIYWFIHFINKCSLRPYFHQALH